MLGVFLQRLGLLAQILMGQRPIEVVGGSSKKKGAAATTEDVDWTPGTEVGDLAIIAFRIDGLNTIDTPAGWAGSAYIVDYDDEAGGNNTKIMHKLLDAADITTGYVTITHQSGRTAHICYTIRDASGNIEIATFEPSSASADADPPLLTPTWGEKENVWLAGCAWPYGDMSVTTWPTDFDDHQIEEGTNFSNNTGADIAMAARVLEAVSQDPSVFTLDTRSNQKISAWIIAAEPSFAPGGSNAWPNPADFSKILMIEGFEDVSDALSDIGSIAMDWGSATAGSPQLFSNNTVDINPGTVTPALSGTTIERLAFNTNDIFAMEMWVYPVLADAKQVFCAMYHGSFNQRNWYFRNSLENKVQLVVLPLATSSAGQVIMDSTATLVLNEWNFVGFAHNGDDFYIYHGLEGGVVEVTKFVTTVRPTGAGAQSLLFGELQSGGNKYTGRIAEFRYSTGDTYFPTDADNGIVLSPTAPWPRS